MAYCRMGTNDLYVFFSVGGHLECCGCILTRVYDDKGGWDYPPGGARWDYHSTQEMIDHIAEHRKAGHKVPHDLESRILRDDVENFPKTTDEVDDLRPRLDYLQGRLGKMQESYLIERGARRELERQIRGLRVHVENFQEHGEIEGLAEATVALVDVVPEKDEWAFLELTEAEKEALRNAPPGPEFKPYDGPKRLT